MGKTWQSVVCAVVLWTFLAMCAPLVVSAQRFDDVGVRAQGMAGAFVAVANDATATWWNPAGLAHGLSFADLTAEIDQYGRRAVAVGFPSLGVSYYHRNISQIQPSNSTEPGASGRQDLGAVGSSLPASESVGVDQMGVTVGQSFGSHLVIGSTLKLERAKSNTRADLDIGAMASLGVVRLGIVMRDVSEPTFGSGSDTLVLPRRARAGAAVLAPSQGRLAAADPGRGCRFDDGDRGRPRRARRVGRRRSLDAWRSDRCAWRRREEHRGRRRLVWRVRSQCRAVFAGIRRGIDHPRGERETRSLGYRPKAGVLTMTLTTFLRLASH